MDPMEEIRETFFLECEELLEDLESGLISFNDGDCDSETINAMFRAVHSIKGGAGAFGLESLVRFAHKFETTLDEVRAGRLEPSQDVAQVFLRSADVLSDLVERARDNDDAEHDAVPGVLAELEDLMGQSTAGVRASEDVTEDVSTPVGDTHEPADDESGFSPMSLDLDLDLEDELSGDHGTRSNNSFLITLKPEFSLYVNGNETGLLLRSLGELGTAKVNCDFSALPTLDSFDPETSYLSWTITLETEASEADIREIFEFVEGDCALEISVEISADREQIDSESDDNFFDDNTGAEQSLENSEASPVSNNAHEASALNTADIDTKTIDATKPSESSSSETKNSTEKAQTKSSPKATLRVDLSRVDRLINLVGELVINQAMLAESVMEANIASSSNIMTGLDELNQLSREIQDSVMAIRAQPVKSLFQRMSRVVREASAATGKSVRLKTEGEATEVDNTVVERLSDPLTHMIRNAVDHGLENAEDREGAGKSTEGTVRLHAAHRSGRVVIEVSDDGAGINRPKVKQIAIDKGLIPEDAVLSDSEIDNLLFMPGFSTAKEVSDLSGRGVGMDVVKRAIQALGGRVMIHSTPGKGTTFSISLPLTLAVLDGMVVRVEDQTVVVPLTSIVETLKPQTDDIHDVSTDGTVVYVRGEFVPVTDVGVCLGYRPAPMSYADSVFLLIEKDDGTRAALAVDSIQDQRQVVIKGLEENYGTVPGVAAATILGDGRIALILDTDNLNPSAGGYPSFPETEMALAG